MGTEDKNEGRGSVRVEPFSGSNAPRRAGQGVAPSLRGLKAPTGDCYAANGRHFVKMGIGDDFNEKARLIHGHVTPALGPLQGERIGHCWIEIGDQVVDMSNGNDRKMPRDVYYILAGIEGGEGVDQAYSWKQYSVKLAAFETWGPWEEKQASQPERKHLMPTAKESGEERQ